MVVPEVPPERTYMLERFFVVLGFYLLLKGTDMTKAAPCLHHSTKLRNISAVRILAA